MIVQRAGDKRSQVHLCREDVQVEAAGKTTHLHAFYNWGAPVTLITHAAAKEAGLEQMKQPAMTEMGLSGEHMDVGSHYMVPVVNGDDKVLVVKAMGVTSIASMSTTSMPDDVEERFPQAKGWESKLARLAK
jgi:hypothetical protein